MGRYVLKRFLMLIPIVIGVSLLVFIMMDLAPGNAIDLNSGDLSTEELAALYHEYGYDRSVFYRYVIYMSKLVRGDLGKSFTYKTDVWKIYMQRLPSTAALAGSSMLVAVVLSIPLGITAAKNHGNLTDNTCSVLAILGLSMPNFWLGIMLMLFFGLKLHWLPSSGFTSWKSLILPAFTVGTGHMAILMRTTRSSMLDVLQQDYLRTARAKGVPEKEVVNKHALRNALIPIITIVGSQLGAAFGGATVTENVFTFPGVGRMLIDSIRQRDTNTVTGCLIMTTFMISVVQLLIDLLYTWVDPRLKSRYASPSRTKKKAPVAKNAVKGGAVNG